MVYVATQERQRISKQVREEDGVHDDVGEDLVIVRHHVVDGVWEAEDQVTDEHCQHGPRRLVHHLCLRRSLPHGGHSALVASYLKHKDDWFFKLKHH